MIDPLVKSENGPSDVIVKDESTTHEIDVKVETMNADVLSKPNGPQLDGQMFFRRLQMLYSSWMVRFQHMTMTALYIFTHFFFCRNIRNPYFGPKPTHFVFLLAVLKLMRPGIANRQYYKFTYLDTWNFQKH